MSEAADKRIADLEKELDAVKELLVAAVLGTEEQKIVSYIPMIRDVISAGTQVLDVQIDRENEFVIISLVDIEAVNG